MENFVANPVLANSQKSIHALIDAISQSEKVTKKVLGQLSRDVVQYITVDQSPDVATVNRLLDVLTPVNRQLAELFFNVFIPHTLKEGIFGGKVKGEKRLDEYLNKAKSFLADPNNNIWTWQKEHNVKLEVKPIDYFGRVSKIVKKALNDEDKPLTQLDIIKAVLSGGVSIEDITNFIDSYTEPEEKVA